MSEQQLLRVDDPTTLLFGKRSGYIAKVIGRRESGKTTLVQSLIKGRKLKNPNTIFCIMTGSVREKSIYRAMQLHGHAYVSDFDREKLQKFVDMQLHRGELSLPLDDIVVVIDSFIDTSFKRDPLYKMLLCNARHLNITLIMVEQYTQAMAMEVNVDAFFFSTIDAQLQQNVKRVLDATLKMPNHCKDAMEMIEREKLAHCSKFLMLMQLSGPVWGLVPAQKEDTAPIQKPS